jgi:SPX domain protein involved in polyphosphate accumulation
MPINSSFTKSSYRIEVKEVFSCSDLYKIEKAIRSSRFAFYSTYPNRRINSLYFDNHQYEYLTDSIEGNSLRTKKRIRWYGQSKDKCTGTLEIKRKQGYLSWKESYKDSHILNTCSTEWKDFILQKKNQSLPHHELLNLKPKSIVCYDRSYYCSFDRKIRITVDQNITTFDQFKFYSPNFTNSRKLFATIIIEIKIDKENSRLLRSVIKELPFSPKRFSKYCESILPSNRNYVM